MHLNDLALLLIAGLVAGTVNAVAGGGSLITFPALVATGLTPISANVSNSVAVFAGFLGGVYGSRDDLSADGRRQSIVLAPTAMAGTGLGCLLLLATPARAFDVVVPFLVLTAAAMIAFSERIRAAVGHPADLSPRRRAWVLHLTVGLGSIYGGYFGAALSIILFAVLSLVRNERLVRINALKNVLSSMIGLVTVVVFGVFGPVNWTDVAILAPATVIGGYYGARIPKRLSPRVLRAVVVVFSGLVGAVLLWRAFR